MGVSKNKRDTYNHKVQLKKILKNEILEVEVGKKPQKSEIGISRPNLDISCVRSLITGAKLEHYH